MHVTLYYMWQYLRLSKIWFLLIYITLGVLWGYFVGLEFQSREEYPYLLFLMLAGGLINYQMYRFVVNE